MNLLKYLPDIPANPTELLLSEQDHVCLKALTRHPR